jgi:hypothetical protein
MSVISRLSVRGGVGDINANCEMREEVATTARVHKRRRAGPRPPKSKEGWNLRRRIDGMRESLPAVRTKET